MYAQSVLAPNLYRVMKQARLSLAGAVVMLMLFSALGWSYPSSLNIEDELSLPGVRLIVVEFYATWCKPCMEAVPRWKALHDKYQVDGLRFIVVASRDSEGACRNPGWTPDRVICDDDGLLQDRFGADTLPAAYLWSWQGQLLTQNVHVDEVEDKILAWMKSAPRVLVEVGRLVPSSEIAKAELLNLIRGRLSEQGKLTVVASEEERVRLRNIVKISQGYSADEDFACEAGKEISPNSLLRASIVGRRRLRLHVGMFSAEEGCQVAAANVVWRPKRPKLSVNQAIFALTRKIRLPRAQLPYSPQDVNEKPLGSLVLTSTPTGAAISIDDQQTEYVTPFTTRLRTGSHKIKVAAPKYRSLVKDVEVSRRGKKAVHFDLTPEEGILFVDSIPNKLEVVLDGTNTSTNTPAILKEVAAGPHEVAVLVDNQPVGKRVVMVSADAPNSIILDVKSETIPQSEIISPATTVNYSEAQNGYSSNIPRYIIWGTGAVSAVTSGVLFGLAESKVSEVNSSAIPSFIRNEGQQIKNLRAMGIGTAIGAGVVMGLGAAFELLQLSNKSQPVTTGITIEPKSKSAVISIGGRL